MSFFSLLPFFYILNCFSPFDYITFAKCGWCVFCSQIYNTTRRWCRSRRGYNDVYDDVDEKANDLHHNRTSELNKTNQLTASTTSSSSSSSLASMIYARQLVFLLRFSFFLSFFHTCKWWWLPLNISHSTKFVLI